MRVSSNVSCPVEGNGNPATHPVPNTADPCSMVYALSGRSVSIMPVRVLRRLLHGTLFAFTYLVIAGLNQAAALDLAAVDNDPNAVKMHIDSHPNNKNDMIYVDGLGRQMYFRGWNVSGDVKLVDGRDTQKEGSGGQWPVNYGFGTRNNKPQGFKAFRDQIHTTGAHVDKTHSRAGYDQIGRTTGANAIRFNIAWEAVHTGIEKIDYDYLELIVTQMKDAIANRMYILLDYHTTLFSRYLFNDAVGSGDTKYAGNGAPPWLSMGQQINPKIYGYDASHPVFYPLSDCDFLLCLHWGQLANSGPFVRGAYYDFWENRNLTSGWKGQQDHFLWQLAHTLHYIKSNLTSAEFDYILGVDNYNEPDYPKMWEKYYGVGNSGNLALAFNWERERLGPFNQKMRMVLDRYGWKDKLVFAERDVHWNSGIHHYRSGVAMVDAPGPGFAFNTHYYDAMHMALNADWSYPGNATITYPNHKNTPILNHAQGDIWWGGGLYFGEMDYIRKEARRVKMPIMLTEFGHPWRDPVGGNYTDDAIAIIKQQYEAMEVTNSRIYETVSEPVSPYTPEVLKAFNIPDDQYFHFDDNHVGAYTGTAYRALKESQEQGVSNTVANGYAEFYAPVISGMQWTWSYYSFLHDELRNGVKLLRDGDAWNQEDFSVVQNYTANSAYQHHQGSNCNPCKWTPEVLERAYPRRAQGRILHMFYNDTANDMLGTQMRWGSIRPDPAEQEAFKDSKFFFMAWKGRYSEAPTEIFLPGHFRSREGMFVITDKLAGSMMPPFNNPVQDDKGNKVEVTHDPGKMEGAGYRVAAWDALNNGEDATDSVHFILLIDRIWISGNTDIVKLRDAIKKRLAGGRSPIYMTDTYVEKINSGGMPAAVYIKHPHETQTPEDWKLYTPVIIENRNAPGMCLGGNQDNGPRGVFVVLRKCNSGDTAQVWNIKRATGHDSALNNDKFYAGRNRFRIHENLDQKYCIIYEYNGTYPILKRALCDANRQKALHLAGKGNGYYNILNNDNFECFSPWNNGTADGTEITQFFCQDIASYEWSIRPVPSSPSGVKQVALASALHIWMLNEAGHILKWNNSTNQWDYVNPGYDIEGMFTNISAAFDGSVYMTTFENKTWVWRPDMGDCCFEIGQNKRQVTGRDNTTRYAIEAGSGNRPVYYQNTVSSPDWVGGLGNAGQISVGIDGELWAIDKQSNPGKPVDPITTVWRRSDDRWVQIDKDGLMLSQIAVGSANQIWGIGYDDGDKIAEEGELKYAVFQRDTGNGTWIRRPGAMTQIDVGSDGTVMAVGLDKRIYRWDGTMWKTFPNDIVNYPDLPAAVETTATSPPG